MSGCTQAMSNSNSDLKKTVAGTCGDEVYWEFNENTGIISISGTGSMFADYEEPEYGPYISAPHDAIRSVTIER